MRGYVAGYNRWLRDTGVDNIADPRCHGEPWVRPITEMDAYRRFYQLGLIASQGVAIDGIGGAQPPAGAGPTPPDQCRAGADDRASWASELPLGGIGSNAYGLGTRRDRQRPRDGARQPALPVGRLGALLRVAAHDPGQGQRQRRAACSACRSMLIGHTDHLAWSHTVSTAYRFTPFELKLVPGSPTTYLYDGQPRQMTSRRR